MCHYYLFLYSVVNAARMHDVAVLQCAVAVAIPDRFQVWETARYEHWTRFAQVI